MFQYKVVPAPSKGRKAPGVKGPEARFANALEHAINALAQDGWEYQRTDILPSSERQGLTSTQTVYRSVLVFRRPVEPEAEHEDHEDHDSQDEHADEDEELDTDDGAQDAEETLEFEHPETEKA